MEKVVLDEMKCFRCGFCVATAKNTFAFDGDAVKVINDEVTEDAKNAMNSCPASAISIEKK